MAHDGAMDGNPIINVNVCPDARKERVTRVAANAYDIEVREPAERNEANTRVRQILARELNVPLKKIQLLTGHRGVRKKFRVIE